MSTPVTPYDCALPPTLWLASRSPRRKELLETLGLKATVFLAQATPEAEALEAPWPQENPLLYVKRVTRLKLICALEALCAQGGDTPAGLVLAADTTVALGDTILGKPGNAEEARHMLQSLSNTTHQVHTGVAVCDLNSFRAHGEKMVLAKTQTSEVHFDAIPLQFIDAYIASGEPFDKAGAYGIQGIIGQYVRHISGSHSGIMGLPLFETSELLRKAHAAAAKSS